MPPIVLCSARDGGAGSARPGRPAKLHVGNADPAQRGAGAAPKPALRYPLLPELGDESRQSDPELFQVFHGAA